jgi:hypothetical protein
VSEALKKEFDPELVWHDGQAPRASSSSFPVRMHDVACTRFG